MRQALYCCLGVSSLSWDVPYRYPSQNQENTSAVNAPHIITLR